MALIITTLNLKGGVGKTTTAVALACAGHRSGAKTVLVDTDPMHGAERWQELAELDGGPGLELPIVGMRTTDLARRLRTTIAADTQLIVIDSPPPGALEIARGAIEVADIVVMPSTPLIADLDRLRTTLGEIARSVRQPPASAVLTMTRPTADRISARDALERWQVRVFRTELPLRAAISRMYGEPVTGLLAEYGTDLLAEVLDVVESS